MFGELKTFWQDESGAEFVEWAVVVIILLVAAVVTYRLVGQRLREILEDIEAWLIAVRTGGEGPGQ